MTFAGRCALLCGEWACSGQYEDPPGDDRGLLHGGPHLPACVGHW